MLAACWCLLCQRKQKPVRQATRRSFNLRTGALGSVEMNQQENFVLKPIGIVRSPIKEVADDCWGGVLATIELDPRLFGRECTLGLD